MSARKIKRRTMGMMLSPAGKFLRGLAAVWRDSPFIITVGPEMWWTSGGFDSQVWAARSIG